MPNDNVYLRQDVIVETLFNQWYAWPYLIPPASAGMYVANSHLKIMQSFVSAPQVHISALKNPAMLGGPFINYGVDRVEGIRQLIAKTVKEQSHMLEFASAIRTLDQILTTEGKGHSLETIYPRVPEILRGYVELVYDLHNHPSIRFLEGLLYKSKYYQEVSQRVVLSKQDCDGRAFVFSTPRLNDEASLNIASPFRHEAFDELFSMRHSPKPFDQIREILNLEEKDESFCRSFFTEIEPEALRSYDGQGVRIRYFGHACILIESKDVSILCDPVISYKQNGRSDRYTYANLPPTIDYVLLTHAHQDHILFETLIQLRHRIKNLIVPKSSGGHLVDPSMKLILRTIGFKNVYEIEEMEAIEVKDGIIVGLPFLGEHADVDVRTKMAYFVNLKGNSALMAADSNNLEPRLYQYLRELLGKIDIVFLGMECDGAPMSWLYGPLLTQPLSRKDDQSRRFDGSNFEKGMALIDVLGPREVYVYAMGQEPWCTFLTSIKYTDESRPIVDSNRLVEACRQDGIVAERLYGQKEICLRSQ